MVATVFGVDDHVTPGFAIELPPASTAVAENRTVSPTTVNESADDVTSIDATAFGPVGVSSPHAASTNTKGIKTAQH